jgi:hypothetical protein
MTPEARETLRRLAEQATDGPWFTVGPPWLPRDVETYVIAGSEDPHAGEIVCDFPCPGDVQDESGDMPEEFVTARNWANAVFIAAANPAVVLSLLDALSAATQERDEARVEAAKRFAQATTPCQKCRGSGAEDERIHRDEHGNSEAEAIKCGECDGLGFLFYAELFANAHENAEKAEAALERTHAEREALREALERLIDAIHATATIETPAALIDAARAALTAPASAAPDRRETP